MTLPADARPVGFLFAVDLDRARAFYGALLGGRGTPDTHGVTLDSPLGKLRLTPAPPGWAASPHPVHGWQVGDIGAGVASLRAIGVTPRIYDGMGQDDRGVWTSPDGAAHVLWFHDSEGNLLSLTQS